MTNYPNRLITKIDNYWIEEFIKSTDINDTFLVKIDWLNIGVSTDLYKYFSEVIWFPDWFWSNWNAFWDIMTDEDFINKDLIIVIRNYQKLFHETKDGYEDKKIFSRILLDLIQEDSIDAKIQIFLIK